MIPIPPVDENEVPTRILLENGSPPKGSPDAPVTMVEFGDYQCQACNSFFHNTEHEIVKNYVDTGKVKIIFKDFIIIGPDSVNAAHAAHCADDQGMFWEYHDTLYNNWTGENNGWAGPENLHKFALDVGLDIDEFTDCMLEARHSQTLQNSNSDARALELTGTPAFFIIDADGRVTKIGGALPYDRLAEILDSSL